MRLPTFFRSGMTFCPGDNLGRLAVAVCLLAHLNMPAVPAAESDLHGRFVVVDQKSLASFFGDSPQSLPDFRYSAFFAWGSESVVLVRSEGPASEARIRILRLAAEGGDVTVQEELRTPVSVGFSLGSIESVRKAVDDITTRQAFEDLSRRLRIGDPYRSTHLLWSHASARAAEPAFGKVISDTLVLIDWDDLLSAYAGRLNEGSRTSSGWAINDGIPRNLSAVENKTHVAFTFMEKTDDGGVWRLPLIPISNGNGETRWLDEMIAETIPNREGKVLRLVSIDSDSRFALLLSDYAQPDMIAALSDPASLWLMDFEAGDASRIETSWWTRSRSDRILPSTEAVTRILAASGIEYEALQIHPSNVESHQARAGEARARRDGDDNPMRRPPQ